MFLDDKLLKMCKEADCTTTENIQSLYVSLCQECESYYKERLSPTMPNYELKALLDKTFNMWDSFVRIASKDDDKLLVILSETFREFSFKKAFLESETATKLYNSL